METCVQFLACPVCGAELARAGNVLRCARSHAFDLSREGYVNLLLSHHRSGRIAGDAKPMLRARRRFLERGHYLPLSDALNERVHAHLDARPLAQGMRSILDVGCGEGYYMGRLKAHLERRLVSQRLCYFGMDLSKEAARLAAGKYDGIRFFVGDVNHRILLADRAVHVLLNVFAPRNPAEFERVAAPGALLLVVIPNPGHLAHLREALDLLEIEEHKRDHVVQQFAPHFTPAGEHVVAYGIELEGEDLHDLVAMTPNYWHSEPSTWEQVHGMGRMRVEVSFTVLEFLCGER